MGQNQAIEYEDLLLTVVEKLEANAFKVELNGFKLLVDPSNGLITFESLKKTSALLGLDYPSDRELMAMIRERDKDGDGALNEQEFRAQGLLEEALVHKIQGVMEN
ncbi:hypothetical protein AMTRI_Chr06g170290 [Amborella trichopoda]